MENWQSIKFRDSMTRKIDYNGIEMLAILSQRKRDEKRTQKRKTYLASGRDQKFPFYRTIKNAIN